MLWKKQVEKGVLVYVDILENNKFDMRKCQAKVDIEFSECDRFNGQPKNDVISAKVRKEGNDLFVQNIDLDAAILKYNKAILLAIADSENLGMCYANRAACFMRLEKYSLCLRDIQLAKLNGYPIRLFAKLDERKTKCLKLMENGKKEPLRVEAKLSFPADEKNADFGSGIAVKQSPNGEKRTHTERNLEIGQTIIIEEPYALISEYPFDYHQCSNCFKAAASLIPCPKCSVAMFCSQKCYDAGHEKFHYIECGINYRFLKYEILRRSVLRTIVMAIQTFGTMEALMDAVESFNSEKKIDKTDEAKKKYFQFFGSRRETESLPHQQESLLRVFVLSMHSVLTCDSILKYMFSSVKNQRFLGHLILHHFYVVNRNAFCTIGFAEHTYKAELGVFHPRLGKVYGNGVALDGMHMRHSCVPNVARVFVDNKIIYKVIRPVSSGEELFITYMHPMASLNPTEIRIKIMSTEFPMKCDCISCTSKSPPFKKCGSADMNASLIPLLNLLEGLPQKFVKRVLNVNRTKLEEYEKSIVEHLQRTNGLHPTEVTLKLQFLLTQIWGNLHAVYHQG